MGNLHSASGITANRNQLGSKARRAAAARSSKPTPTGLMCHVCKTYGHKHLVLVSGKMTCEDCRMCPPVAAAVKQAPQMPAWLTDDPAPAAAQEPTGPVLALPAPRMNEYMRPIRRQLARMCGPRPRYIPSGEVIVLGPGDKPSPYQPEAIATWHERFVTAMGEAIDLAAAHAVVDSKVGAKGHSLNWDMTNAVQRMQHAAFVYANLLMAA